MEDHSEKGRNMRNSCQNGGQTEPIMFDCAYFYHSSLPTGLLKSTGTETVIMLYCILCQVRNRKVTFYIYTMEPLITDTAGEFQFCPL